MATSGSTPKKAIVVGASSGIGRALAVELARNGYAVGLMSRRTALLEQLQAELGPTARVQTGDVSQPDTAMPALEKLIQEMGGVDLVVLNAGTGHVNPDLKWEMEQETIAVNSLGFAALATVAFNYFTKQGRGHLVGISSVAALLANSRAPAYSASKAFASNYLAGLRCRALRAGLPIVVTDIKPGFVDTAMGQSPGRFWVASPEKAAAQIMDAIRRRAAHAYITRRWRLIAWLFKTLPEFILRRVA